MRGVEVLLPSIDVYKMVAGPTGYYSVPVTWTEDPVGSGLFEIASWLVEDPVGSGLYTIPAEYIASGLIPLRNLTGFSVQEDATPIDPSSSFGGAGQITFSTTEQPDSPLLVGQVTLVDGSQGKTSGTIQSLSGSNEVVNIVSDSVLGLFNTERTVPAYIGTLGGAIDFYCDLVGITNDIFVDPTLTSRSVTYPGFKGNVWVHLKQILVKEEAEIALVFNRVYVRPLRLLDAVLDRASALSWSLGGTQAAKAVEVFYYNHDYGTNRELFPLTTEEPMIISGIEAGQEQVFTIPVNASVISVNQPVATNFVQDRSYAGTSGVYGVTGRDNLPVTASQWNAQGGYVRVSVTDDPSVLEVRVRGANNASLAPYRIAMSAGSGSDYNSLHITGTAIAYDKKSITLTTGATNVTTSDEVGVSVDSVFISTLGEAYNLGARAAAAYAGLEYSLTGTAIGINRADDGRELIQATVADFNAQVPTGTLVSEFNTDWDGQTVADFNEYWQNQVDLVFANQLFGNAIGARITAREAKFRVDSVTTNESNVQFTASLDTLVSDFNEVWPEGSTVADFNAQFFGYTSKAFSTVPLRRN